MCCDNLYFQPAPCCNHMERRTSDTTEDITRDLRHRRGRVCSVLSSALRTAASSRREPIYTVATWPCSTARRRRWPTGTAAVVRRRGLILRGPGRRRRRRRSAAGSSRSENEVRVSMDSNSGPMTTEGHCTETDEKEVLTTGKGRLPLWPWWTDGPKAGLRRRRNRFSAAAAATRRRLSAIESSFSFSVSAAARFQPSTPTATWRTLRQLSRLLTSTARTETIRRRVSMATTAAAVTMVTRQRPWQRVTVTSARRETGCGLNSPSLDK